MMEWSNRLKCSHCQVLGRKEEERKEEGGNGGGARHVEGMVSPETMD